MEGLARRVRIALVSIALPVVSLFASLACGSYASLFNQCFRVTSRPALLHFSREDASIPFSKDDADLLCLPCSHIPCRHLFNDPQLQSTSLRSRQYESSR